MAVEQQRQRLAADAQPGRGLGNGQPRGQMAPADLLSWKNQAGNPKTDCTNLANVCYNVNSSSAMCRRSNDAALGRRQPFVCLVLFA